MGGVKVPKVKIGLKGKTGLKIHGKTTKKVTLRLKVKKAGYNKPKGYENAVAPKDFLKGTTCRASFDAAYNMLYSINHARSAVAAKALGCFRAIAQLRGELSCAACDNTKESHFKNSKALDVQPVNLNNLGQCIMFIRYFKKYQTFLGKMLDFVEVLGKDVKAQKTALMAMKLDDTEGCEKVADKKADKKDAKKDDKKDDKKDAKSRISENGFLPALHPKKDDKKDEKKDEKKSRILQALKVKATVPKVAVKAKVAVPKVAVKAKVAV